MSRNGRGRLDKQKRRARKVSRERNVRRNRASGRSTVEMDSFDLNTALERLPGPLQDERVMRRIALVTGQRIFRSPADMLAGMAKLGFTLADGAAKIAERLAREHPLEDAQDMAFVALSSRNPEVTALMVEIALEIDPHCVDAAALAAMFDERGEMSTISRLETVVTGAELALGGHAFVAGCGGRLWDDVLARPYLRARRVLADVLLVAGRRQDAEVHFTELLALDVEDPLQIGETVLGYALERGELQCARDLATRSENSDSPVAPWARALERWLNDDRAAAARLVRRGRAESPLVVQALLEPRSSSRGKPVLPIDMDGPPLHHLAQAVFVELRIGAAWRAHPGALAWLAQGAHATTAEERRAACASFVSPVSTLLSIGDEGLGQDWVDYSTRFGLSSKDVSELVRMATDPAMNDLEELDPRSHAASHAWRALAVLGASEVVEPLLAFHVLRLGHDHLFAELQDVLARIGTAAEQPLVDILKDASRAPLLRGLACESLVHLAGQDPMRRARARTIVAAELALCERNEPDLNAWLVLGLLELRGADQAPVIRRAFECDRVTSTIAGDWESVAAQLGLEA